MYFWNIASGCSLGQFATKLVKIVLVIDTGNLE